MTRRLAIVALLLSIVAPASEEAAAPWRDQYKPGRPIAALGIRG